MPDADAELMTILTQAQAITDATERAAFLDRACGENLELRQKVEALLATHATAGRLFDPEGTGAYEPDRTLTHTPEGAAFEATRTFNNAHESTSRERAPTAELGTVIAGRYTLLETIGEGGMGSVYLASQTEPVKRQVALKLIKSGLDSKGVLARFDAERQALALMDHPNIARIYDGGVTEKGQPFFVMEWVRGESLTAYCDQKKLSVESRLHLFVQVCLAVQHAHQKGIIHRDLKPGNVLITEVDGRPTPKVIDFGVAKATEQKLTDMSFSDVGAIVGTPAYMSPEQADPTSMDIDTRTDVYALGVMLYELLTGSPPIDSRQFKRGALLEMLRMVREVDPPRPSTRLSTADALPNIAANRNIEPGKLCKLLQGELDWVVMKALEKDRSRRYESANSLARDIQHYLADEVVEARPPSPSYRLKKFIKRNKVQVIAASLVFLAMLGGILGTSIGLFQANKAREAEKEQKELAIQAAEKEASERKRAESVARLMETLFRGLNPRQDEAVGLPLRDQLIARLDRFTVDLDAHSSDPLSRSRLQASLGNTFIGLSEFTKGEKALRSALEMYRQEYGPEDPRTESVAFSLSLACERLGKFDESLSIVKSIRDRYRDRPLESDKNIDVDYDHIIGVVLQAAGRLNDAIAAFETAERNIRSRGGPETSETLFIKHTLGAAYREAGDADRAIPLLEQVLAGRSRLLGADQADTLHTQNSLAVAYAAVSRFPDALRLQEDVRARMLKRYGPNNENTLLAAMNLATLQGTSGRSREELKLLEETRDQAVIKLGSENPATLRIRHALGNAYSRAGKHAEALSLYEAILTQVIDLYGENSRFALRVIIDSAESRKAIGQASEAVEKLQPVIERFQTKFGPDYPDTLQLRTVLASLLARTSRLNEVLDILNDTIRRQITQLGEDHLDTLTSYEALGIYHFSSRQAKEAIAAFEKCLPSRIRKLGADHPVTLRTQSSLGAAYWADKQLEKSVPLIEDTLRRQEGVLGIESNDTLSTVENLMINYKDAKEKDKLYDLQVRWLARMMKKKGPQDNTLAMMVPMFLSETQQRNRMQDGIEVREMLVEEVLKHFGPDNMQVLQERNNLAAAYWNGGRWDKSIPILEDIVKALEKLEGPDEPITIQTIGSLSRNYIEAGRPAEALQRLTGVMKHFRAASRPIPNQLLPMHRDYVTALGLAGSKDEAKKEAIELVADVRKRFPAENATRINHLVVLGSTLNQIGEYTIAEPILRECVEVREKKDPASWSIFSARSLLGASLLGQKKHDLAEPLLLSGYEGMKRNEQQLPHASKPRLPETIDKLIELYTAMKKPDDIKKWTEERAKYPPAKTDQPKK